MGLKYAAELPPTPTINVCLIGPPKTGKTTGAASAPGPVLYVNTDLPTATRYARRRYGEKVLEAEFEGLKTLSDVTHEVYNPKTKFKTVVIDTMGELHRRLMDEFSDSSIRPSINLYGDAAAYVERFCRSMCQAPVNAVFVCHDLSTTDEATDEGMVLPHMGTTGKGGMGLGRKLLGMVDVIGFTGVRWVTPAEGEKAVPEYVAQLTANKGRPGGDRFGGILGADGGMRKTDLSEWIQAITAAEQEQPTKQEAA